MQYNKLVRDKIPEFIEGKGKVCRYHVAEEVEYWQKIKEKCQEELDEFVADESMSELADLLEVIDAIIEYKNFSRDELQAMQMKKRKEKGGFSERIILDEA